jgi:hypothetical protein
MYEEFLDELKKLLNKHDCFPINVYKVSKDIFYVNYFDRKRDYTNYCHFSFEDHLIKQIKLEQIK